MRVAATLGRTLAEIGEVDIEELAMWIAFLDDDGPETRADWRTARLQATVANAAIAWNGKIKADDFMPSKRSNIPHDEAEKRLALWCAAFGTVEEGGR